MVRIHPRKPVLWSKLLLQIPRLYPGLLKRKVIGAPELNKFPKKRAVTSDRVAPLATAPASAFAAGPHRFLDFMPFITDVAGPAWGVAGMSGNELFQCLNILNIHAISSPVFFSLIPQTLQWPPNRAICSLQGFPLLKRRVRCHTVPTSDCICKHMIVPYEKILGTS